MHKYIYNYLPACFTHTKKKVCLCKWMLLFLSMLFRKYLGEFLYSDSICSGFSLPLRSRTLVALDAPSTPTWWTRTRRPSTRPGPRRALRTASSSSRRRPAWGMCSTGPQWRRGRPKMWRRLQLQRLFRGTACGVYLLDFCCGRKAANRLIPLLWSYWWRVLHPGNNTMISNDCFQKPELRWSRFSICNYTESSL